MKSKEKVLNDQLEYDHFNPDDFTDRAKSSIHSAMDEHARNCMIEFLVFMKPTTYTYENAGKVVDGFLSSEYFKEIQEP